MTLTSFFKIVRATFITVALWSATGGVMADSTAEQQEAQPDNRPAMNVWIVKLPQEDKVSFQGVVNFDNAGVAGGGMLYPAAGAGGFLAAIITHGVIMQSIKAGQKTKIQEAADQVLVPYQPVLSTYHYQELAQEALKKAMAASNRKLLAFSETADAHPLIESTPVFSLTQDQSAVVLENLVSVTKPATSPSPAYQNIIKVVSQPKEGAEFPGFWMANDGAKLKEESANLLAHSLAIAIRDAENPAKEEAGSQKTFRYQEGQIMKMERAQLISTGCNRTIIKNLRGWVMSIPVQMSDTSATHQCADIGIASVIPPEINRN
jgi:hypothetical protein